MSSSDEEFEADCESFGSDESGDEGEIDDVVPGEANREDDIPAAQHRLLVVRGRQPYMFEPMARQRNIPENMEVDDGNNIGPAPINYDDRLGNTDW